MKQGDLVEHVYQDKIGVLLRMYVVYNDSVPEDVVYMRCVMQSGHEIISAPMSSIRLVEEANNETCQTR